jgi:gliding motility-associated-like protein
MDYKKKIMKSFLSILTLLLGFSVNSQCNGSEPVVNLGNDTVLCNGQSLYLSAPVGFDYYNWSNGSTLNNITVNTAGTYSVIGSVVGTNTILHGDFGGGTTAAANNFTTAYIPGTGGSWGILSTEGQYAISTSPSLVHNNFSVCGDHTTGTGNMLIANGSGLANTIVWSQTVTVTPGVNYVFSFWEANALNAVEVSSLQLYINNVPISSIVPTSTTACTWLQNTGFWNSGGATTAILSIVNQSTLTSGNDFAIDDIFFAPVCTSTDTINVQVEDVIIDAGPDLTFCANETGLITATTNVPIATWSWGSGQTVPTVVPDISGLYQVVATSVNGCVGIDGAQVTIIPINWTISDVISGPTDCGANSGYVSAITGGTFNDPAAYTWSGPGANSSSQINASVWQDLSVGWYYLEVESDGCFQYDSVQVVPSNPPSAALTASPISGYYPLSVNFQNNSQNADEFFWNFGNGNVQNETTTVSQNQVYDTTGVYTVMLVAGNGACSDTAYVTINVLEPPVFVPVDLETANVFTPNNDGVNDIFQFNMLNIVEIEFTILNRWGNVMFTTTDVNAGWNGKSNGINAEPGVYFYTFKAKGAQDEPFEGQGFIHLVR